MSRLEGESEQNKNAGNNSRHLDGKARVISGKRLRRRHGRKSKIEAVHPPIHSLVSRRKGREREYDDRVLVNGLCFCGVLKNKLCISGGFLSMRSFINFAFFSRWIFEDEICFD